MFHRLLTAYFSAFFLFWLLGVDQLFFVFFCLVGFFAFLANEKSFPGAEVVCFALFVLATFFSVVQISTTVRYITYLRNEGVYITMLFIMLSYIFASAGEKSTTDKLYFAVLFFSLQCTLVAFLASNGISIALKTAAAYVIPDMGTKYIASMLNKDSIQAEALWFSKGFVRPRGLMMYPNTMAGVLASTMAIKAYFIYKFWRDNFKLFAVLCLIAIGLDLFSVYASLSRSTWLGIALAFVGFLFFFKTSPWVKIVPLMAGVLVLGFVFITGMHEGIESRLVDKTHSNEGRGLNYRLIWEETTSSLDKFLLGHGTQVDHPLLGIPLGSHSTYLGVFFKFGIFGFIFILLFLLFLYRRALALARDTRMLNEQGIRHVRPYFICFALIVPVGQMMFIEVDVDMSYAVYFATIVLLLKLESDYVHKRLT